MPTPSTPTPSTPTPSMIGGAAFLRAVEDHDLFLRGRGGKRLRLPGARIDGNGLAIDRADLSGADLRGAVIDAVSMLGCSLARADLQGSIWRRVDARWSNFSQACLHGADLRGALLDGAIGFDPLECWRTSFPAGAFGGAKGFHALQPFMRHPSPDGLCSVNDALAYIGRCGMTRPWQPGPMQRFALVVPNSGPVPHPGPVPHFGIEPDGRPSADSRGLEIWVRRDEDQRWSRMTPSTGPDPVMTREDRRIGQPAPQVSGVVLALVVVSPHGGPVVFPYPRTLASRPPDLTAQPSANPASWPTMMAAEALKGGMWTRADVARVLAACLRVTVGGDLVRQVMVIVDGLSDAGLAGGPAGGPAGGDVSLAGLMGRLRLLLDGDGDAASINSLMADIPPPVSLAARDMAGRALGVDDPGVRPFDGGFNGEFNGGLSALEKEIMRRCRISADLLKDILALSSTIDQRCLDFRRDILAAPSPATPAPATPAPAASFRPSRPRALNEPESASAPGISL